MLNVKHDLPVHTVAISHPGADGPELTGVLGNNRPTVAAGSSSAII